MPWNVFVFSIRKILFRSNMYNRYIICNVQLAINKICVQLKRFLCLPLVLSFIFEKNEIDNIRL